MTQWFWQRVAQRIFPAGSPIRICSGRRARPIGCRLVLETLEDRTVPSILTVTNLLDAGDGSLRDQIAAAANGDTILFDSSLRGTISLTSGELDITQNFTIQGPGAANLTVSGNNSSASSTSSVAPPRRSPA